MLEAANLLCLPGDRLFKPHQKQLVHQRKRIRAATQALKRLSKWLIGVSSDLERNEITSSEEFQKLTRCAMLPLQTENDTVDGKPSPKPSKEDVEIYCDAIRALGTLCPPQSIVNIVNSSLAVMNEHIAKTASDASISGTVTALERLNLAKNDIVIPIANREKDLNLPFKLLPSLLVNEISIEE